MVNNMLTTSTANNNNDNLQSMVIVNGMTANSHQPRSQVTKTVTGTEQVANRFPASLTTLILKTLCQAMLMIICRRLNSMLISQVKLNRYRLIRCSSGRIRSRHIQMLPCRHINFCLSTTLVPCQHIFSLAGEIVSRYTES